MISIARIDHENSAQREALCGYLAGRERHCLFILGNLKSGFPGQNLYVASREGKCVGVAGYYAAPKSLIPYSEDAQVVRELVRHVASAHRPIDWVNGIGYAAWPAYEELVAMGFRPINEPHQLFMELPLKAGALLRRFAHEEKVRMVRAEDGEDVARLMRLFRNPDDRSPVTAEEVARAMMNPIRVVLEEDGRPVASACTNGLGVKAFQILAVATLPEYRNRGYARAVCAALIRLMQGRGAEHCVLFTHVNNAPAQRCYGAMGFEVTGEYCLGQLGEREC